MLRRNGDPITIVKQFKFASGRAAARANRVRAHFWFRFTVVTHSSSSRNTSAPPLAQAKTQLLCSRAESASGRVWWADDMGSRNPGKGADSARTRAFPDAAPGLGSFVRGSRWQGSGRDVASWRSVAAPLYSPACLRPSLAHPLKPPTPLPRLAPQRSAAPTPRSASMSKPSLSRVTLGSSPIPRLRCFPPLPGLTLP